MADPNVIGTVTVKGVTLDRSGPVAWDSGAPTLQWDPDHRMRSGWSSRPSTMLVKNAGCFQLDVSAHGIVEKIILAAA